MALSGDLLVFPDVGDDAVGHPDWCRLGLAVDVDVLDVLAVGLYRPGLGQMPLAIREDDANNCHARQFGLAMELLNLSFEFGAYHVHDTS